MGAKGGGGGGTQTVTQKTELPGWVTEAAQKNLNQAYNVSQSMPDPYGGPRYAGLTDGAKADIAGLQLQVGQTQPSFELAKNAAAGLMNYQPGRVQAGSYDAAQIGSIPQMDASRIDAAPQMAATTINNVPQMQASFLSGMPQVQASMIGGVPAVDPGKITGSPTVNADEVSAQLLRNTDLNPYLNPYTQGEIGRAHV